MGNSPFRSRLYRKGRRLVICAGLVLIAVAAGWAQFARKSAASKGPRAVGLLMMPAKGQPRLIPVAIMVDGHFYDASAYKADPVPMALEPGTVYEAQRTGESLGLFTINQDLQQQKTNTWIAQGTYHANGEQVTSSGHKAESRPREDKDEGPPVLRRPGSTASKPASAPSESKPANPAPESKPASAPAEAKPTNPPLKTETTATAPPPQQEEPEDPNRPKLRRGKPEKATTAEKEPEPAPAPVKKSAPNANASSPMANAGKSATDSSVMDVQLIPAISDADGPEAHAYKYEMTPAEEAGFRAKILALATDELRKQAKAFTTTAPASTGATAAARPRRLGGKASSKPPQPTFDDVQLRVFDVAASNEPVLVLTATAHPPQTSKEEMRVADYYVTLAARSDINGELRKLLSVVTDSEHLDVNPRLQLIDAVDADGDGRGELLFRQISDAGSAYAIYRVLPDRLWSLYEGTPQ
jgi:hypothetical protein